MIQQKGIFRRLNHNFRSAGKVLVEYKGHFKSPKCKVLDQPDVKDTLQKLHANYVLVPADKAAIM